MAIIGNTYGIIETSTKKVVSCVLSQSELENAKKYLQSGYYVCVQWNHFWSGDDEMIILENTDFRIF